MKKIIIIALLALSAQANAQIEGVWEEFIPHQGELSFMQNIEVVEVNGIYVLLSKKKTFTFRRRMDGMIITNTNQHGEYYSFDENMELHAHDSDGQLDPEYVILNKI